MGELREGWRDLRLAARAVAVLGVGLMLYLLGYGDGVSAVVGLDGWTRLRLGAELAGNVGLWLVKALCAAFLVRVAVGAILIWVRGPRKAKVAGEAGACR